MRVIFLGTRGFPNVQGGVEKHCQELTVHLTKLGCEVIVFTRSPYVDKAIKEYKGVKLVALPAVRVKSLEACLHTVTGVFAALKFRPDILHIQAIGPGLFAPLARMLGMRVVLTTHGSNYKHQKWSGLAKLIFRIGEYLGLRFSNSTIAISRTIADDMEEKYKRKVNMIPNGIESVQIAESDATLRQYGLERKKYIMAIGRFVKGKGFEDLIDALALAQRTQSIAHKLVIVGDADHEDAYSRGLKEKARGNPNIVLTGILSGTPLQEIYSHAGLFVLPSFYEGLPIVLLEAMSYGLSCLASDIPANRSLKLCQARYFKPGDIKSLGTKIIEFIHKPVDMEERSRQVDIIRKNYNWDRVAEQTLEVYKKVINE